MRPDIRDLQHVYNSVIAHDHSFPSLAHRRCVDLEEVRKEESSQIWARIWPLPLYSNVRVKVASKRIEAIEKIGLYENFSALARGVGDRRSPWYIEKRSGTEPVARGHEAKNLREGSGHFASYGIRIPARFQLRIYRLAALLQSAQGVSATYIPGSENVLDRLLGIDSSSSLPRQLPIAQRRLASAVGTITSLHILMDLGIPGVIKPDIWMVRIPHAIGALDGIDVAKYSKGNIGEVVRVTEKIQPLADHLYALMPTKNPMRALDLLFAYYGHHNLGAIGRQVAAERGASCAWRPTAAA